MTQECLGTDGVNYEVLVSSGDPHSATSQQVWLRGKAHPEWLADQKISLVSYCPLPLAGLTVNGQIIGDKGNSSKNRKTYLGKVGIVNALMDFRIEVTTEKITLQNGAAQSTFSWLDSVTVTSER